MTKTVTISAVRTDGTPYAHHDVIVTLVAGSAGGVVGSNVVVEQSAVRLDANGAGSIVLATNDAEVTSPPQSFYRFTVAGSSPTITRSIALTSGLPSSVSWSLAGIQVADPVAPQRSVSSDYVDVDGESLTNVLDDLGPGGVTVHGDLTGRNAAGQHTGDAITVGLQTLTAFAAGVARLGAANEFTESQSIDVDVPVTPFAAIGSTKPTVMVHMHAQGGAVVDLYAFAVTDGTQYLETSGTMTAVIGTDGVPTDDWVVQSIGPNGEPAYALATSTDPGELPWISDLLTALLLPLIVGDPTRPEHAATKGYVDDLDLIALGAQPADPDLTSIAALITTAWGRALLTLADAAAGRSTLGLGTAATAATGDFATAAQGAKADAALVGTLADAKGDLLVATAADTIARLPVGGDGRVPVADTASTAGIMWAQPTRTHYFRTGEYTATAPRGSDSTPTVNRLMYQPLPVPYRMSFDRIGIFHASGVSAGGSVVRLGRYDLTGDMPGALVTEYGTVDLSTTAGAIKAITIALTLDPGLYWFGSVAQFTGTTPSLGWATTTMVSMPGADHTAAWKFENGVTGSLPATATPGASNSGAASIYLRRSA